MKSEFPIKKASSLPMSKLQSPSELERILLSYNKILYQQGSNEIILVMDTDDKTIAFTLADFEGAMASFIYLGCAVNSHIKTIHQMYLALLEEHESSLESAVIESMQGDVVYVTLEFKNKKGHKYRTLSSFADAVMLTALAGVNIYILKKVLDEFDDFKELTYYREIIDQDDDEF